MCVMLCLTWLDVSDNYCHISSCNIIISQTVDDAFKRICHWLGVSTPRFDDIMVYYSAGIFISGRLTGCSASDSDLSLDESVGNFYFMTGFAVAETHTVGGFGASD